MLKRKKFTIPSVGNLRIYFVFEQTLTLLVEFNTKAFSKKKKKERQKDRI